MQAVTPTTTTTYSLTCTGTGGTITQSIVVTVTPATPPPPPIPTLTLSASPTTITAGQQSTLTWSSTNATACTATGTYWGGSRPTSGTFVTAPTTTATFSLSCTGAGGTASNQVTVTVSVPPPPPPGAFTEGMVTLSFDDSWLSQYTNALPILQTAGIKGTFYLTTQPLQEGWTDFMTPANVLDIATKGHEIADHTVTHPHMPLLTAAQINTEIFSSRTYLQNLTGKSVTTIAYPYGEFNATVKSLVQKAGYTAARGVEEDALNTGASDKFNLKSSCVLKSTPFSVIKAAIDAAKANKQWYIPCFHEIRTLNDEYSLTTAQFQQIVNYVKSSGIKVVTVQQGVALMTP